MSEKRREVCLTVAERHALEKFVAHGEKAPAIHQARILLLIDEASPAKELTNILGISRCTADNVHEKSLQQAHEHRLDWLHEAPRRGRPLTIDTCVERL